MDEDIYIGPQVAGGRCTIEGKLYADDSVELWDTVDQYVFLSPIQALDLYVALKERFDERHR